MKILSKFSSVILSALLIFPVFFSTQVQAAGNATVTYPVTNTSYNIIPFNYTYLHSPDPLIDAKISFAPLPSGTAVLMYLDPIDRTSTLYFNPKENPTTNPAIHSADFSSLADGSYDVIIAYVGLDSNVYSETVNNVTIDSLTQTPTLTAPAANSTVSALNVNFTIPENALAGSTKLLLTDTTTSAVIILTLIDPPTHTYSFTIDPTNISASPNISSVVGASSNKIPNGNYNAVFVYQDSTGNPTASAVSNNVTILQVTPTTTAPVTTTVTATTLVPTTNPVVAGAVLADTGENILLTTFGALLLLGAAVLINKTKFK